MIPDTLFYDLYHFCINYYKSIDYHSVTPNVALFRYERLATTTIKPYHRYDNYKSGVSLRCNTLAYVGQLSSSL
jgi:hypothetical protein